MIEVDPVLASAAVAFLLAVVGAIPWFGKLSNRVQRLESDMERFTNKQDEVLEYLHQHIGFHKGRGDHPPQ